MPLISSLTSVRSEGWPRSSATMPSIAISTFSGGRCSRASGAVHSVAQAISRNPFMIIVPCHRVLEAGSYADKISPNGGAISKRRLLSIEGAHTISSKTLFDVLLPVAPPRPQG